MEEKLTAKRDTFKGHPMLELSFEGDKFPLRFGLGKAKRIVACLEDIKKFVAEEEAKLAGDVPAKTVVVK